MIHAKLRAALLTFDTLTALVGQNEKFDDVSDRYVIRPGRLFENDPYPGVAFRLPSIAVDGDLSGRGGFSTAVLEVAAITFDLDQAWEMAKAICWNGGEPDDVSRVLSGLDGYRNFSGNGLQAIKLTGFLEDQIEPDDKSDRLLWVVQASFSVAFDLGIGIV